MARIVLFSTNRWPLDGAILEWRFRSYLFGPFLAKRHVSFNPMVFYDRTIWIRFGKSLFIEFELSTASHTRRIIIGQTIFGTDWWNFLRSYFWAIAAFGGFQLLNLIITELKSHMTYYNSMPLIGWNYSIQTGEQIL